MIAQAGIMDCHHSPAVLIEMTITGIFPHHSWQGSGMAVLTMDDIRAVIKQDHQVQGRLLKKEIHGKIIKMTVAALLPALPFFLFSSIGVDAQFFGKSPGLKQVQFNPPDLFRPD